MSPWLLSAVFWIGPVDTVAVVEVNTFGQQPRTVILYRDRDESIVDWRWYTSPDQVPKLSSKGRYSAVWNDQGKPRTVYCDTVRYTRTLDDVELAERAKLPDHSRRRLSR
jgi:hypothetical protein